MHRVHEERRDECIRMMVATGLIAPWFEPDMVPDFPSEVPEGVYLGAEPVFDEELRVLRLPPYVWFPCIANQVQSADNDSVLARWRAERGVPAHWVLGAALCDDALPNDVFLPTSVMGFGDALCIVAQIPSVERCCVEQPMRLRMQAYAHPLSGAFVLGMHPHDAQSQRHMVGLLWQNVRPVIDNRLLYRHANVPRGSLSV